MAFKRIVLHVDELDGYEDRLAATLFAARKDGSVIAGVYAILPPEIPGYVATMLPEDILRKNWEAALQEAEEMGERFRKACAGAEVACEWHLMRSRTVSALAREGRTADFIVVGQPGTDSTHLGDDSVVESLVLEAGRPVLMLPRGHTQMGLGARVALAWNGSRESARALADGLPWLQRATRVDIVVVAHPGEDFELTGADDVKTRLGALGIDATVDLVDASAGHAASALLEWTRTHSPSLLVMGAYGHSRFRELVLGGATARLITDSAVPLLLSH